MSYPYDTTCDVAEQKRRQLIRQTTPSLRHLESQLRLAYIDKERKAQIEQKKLKKEMDKREQEFEAERLSADAAEAAKEDEERDRRDQVQRIRYLKQLDVQLIEKQSERDVAYMEFLQEKRLIDEVIAKVKAEQRKARIEAVVKKEVLKEDVHRFMEAQEVFVRMEKERTERENSRILEFVDHKDKWTIDQEAIEAERRKFKHGAVSKLAEEMGRTQKEVLEKEEILHELHEGRMRDEERRREADEMTRELRKRLAFKESNEAAVAYREMVKERERAKDEEWRRKWIEEMEAKERLEQMSDAKRRMKRLELKREVERIMAERQVEREIEKLDEARFWQEQKEREAEMDRVVEEERMRMLKAHASRLVGHLPGGIIKEEDLDHLGEEVRMAFRKRPRYRDPLECLEEQYK